MFEYMICTVFDTDIFDKQCTAIEKYLPNLKKNECLEDVDGTLIQVYQLGDSDIIKVINDPLTGITVESTKDIRSYFHK